MKIVSWQSVLTDHQSHTMRALQEKMGEPLVIISGVKELKERKSQGWTATDTHDLDVRYLPKNGWWKAGLKVLRDYPNSIHMFNSMWGDRRFFPLLLAAQYRGIDTALMTEPYAEVGVGYLSEGNIWLARLKAALRPLLYRCGGLLVAKKLKVVFAISDKARTQFIHIGVDQEKVFPFGYYIPAMKLDGLHHESERKELKLIYVGSLIRIKGIHILCEAMKTCQEKELDVVLDVYGPGDARVFENLDGVYYKGMIPFGQAQRVIAEYDVLVLPSLHDGWGVVVNEAILQGVPVIVSDQVGAKTLIEKSGAGEIFPVCDAVALADVCENLVNDTNKLEQWKKHAMNYSAEIDPLVAANYLYQHLLPIYKESFSFHVKDNNI